jgi:hypothetical protein
MSEEIERWVNYMKKNPNTWKTIHTKFINSQFEKSKEFIIRLTKLSDGKEKIKSIYKIKNVNGYKKILN